MFFSGCGVVLNGIILSYASNIPAPTCVFRWSGQHIRIASQYILVLYNTSANYILTNKHVAELIPPWLPIKTERCYLYKG